MPKVSWNLLAASRVSSGLKGQEGHNGNIAHMTSDPFHPYTRGDSFDQPPDRSRIPSTRRVAEGDLVDAHLDQLLSDVGDSFGRDGTFKGAFDDHVEVSSDSEPVGEGGFDDLSVHLDVRSDGRGEAGNRVGLLIE
jgi:hypothetical protein